LDLDGRKFIDSFQSKFGNWLSTRFVLNLIWLIAHAYTYALTLSLSLSITRGPRYCYQFTEKPSIRVRGWLYWVLCVVCLFVC
jgi:hypothetical protein